MEDLVIIVYTMKNCPFCIQFKDMLKNESISFIERDIDVYKKEYDLYSKATNNDYVPALMIIENYGEANTSYLYAPERDYSVLEEAVGIIKKHTDKLI